MRSIPHVSESDLVRWEQVLRKIEPAIAADIAARRLQRGRRIAQRFRNRINWGLLNYAKGDTSLTLRAFSDAVDRFMLFFDVDNAKETDSSHMYNESAEVLEIALIVQAPALVTIAQMLLPLHGKPNDPRSIYVRTLCSLILGDKNASVTEAAALAKLNSSEFSTAIPGAILALGNGDHDGFRENLQAAMADFDRLCATQARGTPEAAVFLKGVALMRLFERSSGEPFVRAGLDVRLMPE